MSTSESTKSSPGWSGRASARVRALLVWPEDQLDDVQRQWMQPPSRWDEFMHRALGALNRRAIRGLFRFRVSGIEQLPDGGPFILAANHASSLDPFALAAALDRQQLCRTYWIGRREALLRNPWRRYLNRAARAVPVHRSLSALAVGAQLLKHGENMVWFPEGTRSTNGRLQRLRWGAGILASHFHVPIVPAWLNGTHQAWPPHRRWPRLGAPIAVRFGRSVDPGEFPGGNPPHQQVTCELAKRLRELADDEKKGRP